MKIKYIINYWLNNRKKNLTTSILFSSDANSGPGSLTSDFFCIGLGSE